MKNPPIVHLTVLLLYLASFCSVAQSYPVPETVEFAGVSINISKDAQGIIQNDIKTLLGNKTYLNAKLDRVALYFPIIETMLADEGIPEDFKYLAVQESGLLPDAVSKSNAVGFWQFKKETAMEFGLRVDDQIDERKNIHASTRAACLYLKRNNLVLNNWISSLNSYRTGLSNVYKYIAKEWYGSKEISVTAKTDFYVLRAIAHKLVLEKEIAKYKPSDITFFEYTFNAGKAISFISKELVVSEDDIWKYNRWMSGTTVPEDKPYTMLIALSEDEIAPMKEKVLTMNGKADIFTEDLGFPVLTRITAKTKNKNVPIFYNINNKAGIQAQVGDDVESICVRADFDVEDFIKFNDLADGLDTKIVPNEIYYLEKKAKKAPVPFHTVTNATEQSLWKVSQMYGICLSKLLKYNRLDAPQRLVDGRVLWLQKTRPSNSPVEVITVPNKPVIKEIAKNTEVVASKNVSQQKEGEGVKVVDLTLTEAKEPKATPVKEEVVAQTTETEEFKPNIPVQIHQVTNYTHTVTSGENFYSIARKYNISVSDVWAWNKMNKDVKLGIGKKLLIKFGHYYEPTSGTLAQGTK
ncbi:membrane-bound lytic murein transglycosylase D [Arcicella aurantiaca]|uniref:Membrane-bound lytic murein transglycosylase D n=1 Tax=Arcicella aurantiaca TaxID=591202 RepID=A0A316DXJ4_9BACT|nr:transglycosylase SLT domain-containing protein [Arcicella aurantiaca]PWK22625.1 membrane-bound lytic murein transglycosylase D [Arcicella aurantiaca]